MPPAFTLFRRRHPDVTLTVVDDHLQRLITRLDAGELDLALIYDHEALADIAARQLERTPLLDDAFQAVLPADHRLTRRRRPLTLTDLSDEPWIGGAPTSAWFRIVTHACRHAGFTPEIGFASDDHIAVQALVAAGLGVSVIPGLAVVHPLPGLAIRTLGESAPIRHISAARPRDAYHGPAVTAMLDSLRAGAKLLPAPRHPQRQS
jgi:DNA-binding transcriptional LysR family regulator